jgi:Helix-turn-helix domain
MKSAAVQDLKGRVAENATAAGDRFGWIQSVLRDRKLPASARCLAVILSDFVNSRTGIAYPTQAKLAQAMGVSVRSVMRLMPLIAARGHIEIVRLGDGRGKASEYRLARKGVSGDGLSRDKGRQACRASASQRVTERVVKGDRLGAQRATGLSPLSVETNQFQEPVEYISPGFETFWSVYPRKVAKEAARRAYERIAGAGTVSADEIVAGAQRYAEARQTQDPTFTKHPATWLNGGCWNDEEVCAPSDCGVNGAVVAAARAMLERRGILQ